MTQTMKNYIKKLLDKETRLDGRKTDEYRKPIKVEYGVVNSAEGSARVTIGETVVLAGVKLEVIAPYPDVPNKGTIIVGAELLPLSNPEFEPGPPGIQAIEIARVVDRGIRESEALDFAKMCITPGEKVWACLIDICPINDAGNLFDAGALAVLAALKDAKYPKYDGEKIDYSEKTKESLPLSKEPLSCTVLKIGDHYVVDPVTEEEKVYDARLSVAALKDGSLCAMQKGGEEPLTSEQLLEMVDLAVKKTKELRKSM